MTDVGVPLERFWKTINPLTRPLAGYVPWWVVVETTGRNSGVPRRTPLANAPQKGSAISVLSVYGESAAFVKNLRADPSVRIKRRGRWRQATAEVVDVTPDTVSHLGLYARTVLIRLGRDPKVVQLSLR